MLTFFNVFTDFMEKNMPDITPSSESSHGLPQWLLAVFIVVGIIILIITLLMVVISAYLSRKCMKQS